jgi:uncharacterized phage-associated protein
MLAYRKERIENAMLFFAKEHYKKTKKYLSQTALYKYLAFFEFRHLEIHGEMPLELHYKAMEYGPVPIEIYSNRDNPSSFPLVIFEKAQTSMGKSIYLVRPNGKFEEDYFSENELTEMNNLIEIFAQKWVGARVMSDASHQEIRAWKKTYSTRPNATIDPIDDFPRDIVNVSFDELKPEEERYLNHRKLMEYVK